MSKFALALLHPAYDWKDRATTRFYKAEYLGRSNGKTFLWELFPLPAASKKTNPCREEYRTRDDYDRQVLPARIRWISDAIKRHKPRYIIIYGASRKYRDLISEVGALLVKKVGRGELYRYKTTKILLFSFFSRGLSLNQVGRVLRLLKDDRIRDHLKGWILLSA